MKWSYYSEYEMDGPSDGEDVDEEERSCRFCDKTKVVKRKPRDMLVHYGLIASSNQVIRDATLRDTLSKRLSENVLYVEMEAARLMNDFPYRRSRYL
jgi:nucleoside phosphorylase